MRKPKKRLNQLSDVSDYGTPERLGKAGTDGVMYERTSKQLGSAKRVRIVNQTMLDRYMQREQISRRQYEAGLELYRLWFMAGRSQRVLDYSAVRVDGGGAGGETVGEAFSAYMAALRDIGRDLSSVAQWVAIEGMTARDWGEREGHDPKGGIVALRLALDALGDHFGMARA